MKVEEIKGYIAGLVSVLHRIGGGSSEHIQQQQQSSLFRREVSGGRYRREQFLNQKRGSPSPSPETAVKGSQQSFNQSASLQATTQRRKSCGGIISHIRSEDNYPFLPPSKNDASASNLVRSRSINSWRIFGDSATPPESRSNRRNRKNRIKWTPRVTPEKQNEKVEGGEGHMRQQIKRSVSMSCSTSTKQAAQPQQGLLKFLQPRTSIPWGKNIQESLTQHQPQRQNNFLSKWDDETDQLQPPQQQQVLSEVQSVQQLPPHQLSAYLQSVEQLQSSQHFHLHPPGVERIESDKHSQPELIKAVIMGKQLRAGGGSNSKSRRRGVIKTINPYHKGGVECVPQNRKQEQLGGGDGKCVDRLESYRRSDNELLEALKLDAVTRLCGNLPTARTTVRQAAVATENILFQEEKEEEEDATEVSTITPRQGQGKSTRMRSRNSFLESAQTNSELAFLDASSQQNFRMLSIPTSSDDFLADIPRQPQPPKFLNHPQHQRLLQERNHPITTTTRKQATIATLIHSKPPMNGKAQQFKKAGGSCGDGNGGKAASQREEEGRSKNQQKVSPADSAATAGESSSSYNDERILDLLLLDSFDLKDKLSSNDRYNRESVECQSRSKTTNNLLTACAATGNKVFLRNR